MEFNFSSSQIRIQEEKLASGDATCTDYLLMSSSLTDLLPDLDTELPKEKKNADMWRYGEASEASTENVASEGDASTPKFVPIGSLEKTQYRDSSKREGKNLIKSSKRETRLFDQNNRNPKGSHSNECFTPQPSQPALNFGNMARLFSCQACYACPMTSMTVHLCKHGHQVCGNCFNHDTTCAICGEQLEGRNNPVEMALQKLKSLRPELFFHEFLTPSTTDDLGEVTRFKAVHQSSHKPVQCPHLSCHSSVAYNGFVLHFQFEHSTVPILSTYLDCPHQFPLQETLLNNKSARVLRVFKVNLMKVRSKRFDGYPIICCLLSIPIHIGYVKSLAVWCSCTDDGASSPIDYSLKSLSPRRFITYRGPIASLHESVEGVLRDGRCLIVPPEMLENFPLPNDTLQIEFFMRF